MKSRKERAEIAAAERQAHLAAIAAETLEFVPMDELAAVPAIGGMLSDFGTDRLRRDFVESDIAPVSARLAAAEQRASQTGKNARFVVVQLDARRVALTPDEATARDLEEDITWGLESKGHRESND